jgi:predicted transcriptional regulator
MAIYNSHVFSPYEEHIIDIMDDLEVTLLEALVIDLYDNSIDVESILEITDHFEKMLNMDMKRVSFFMQVLMGQSPDLEIKR